MFVGGEMQGNEGTCMHLGVTGRCDVGRNEWGFRGLYEDLLGMRFKSDLLPTNSVWLDSLRLKF